MKKAPWFARFARFIAHESGRPRVFALAFMIVVLWAITGPIFGFSDTWQLVINTGTTVVTFLMVFLIQGTQNQDTGAIHIKLNELIRAINGAHMALLNLEELDPREIERYHLVYQKLAERAREALRRGEQDTGTPDLNIPRTMR